MTDLQVLHEDLDDFAYSALHGLCGLAISPVRDNYTVREYYLYVYLLSLSEVDDDDGLRNVSGESKASRRRFSRLCFYRLTLFPFFTLKSLF